MQNPQPISDKIAISLSLACAVHCLITPFLLVAMPSLAVLGLGDELFHKTMAILVIPTSIISLTIGCKTHKKYRLLMLSFIGLTLLISALMLHENLGEIGEKLLTVIGAAFISYSHYSNFKLCQAIKHCPCSEDSK
ncbi:MerC domain-containing protein [Kangiella geojedonensis]|uniref:MerC mercury resistance protein n=1 Tax=Kangiella geojedonensis TaxID=914150 RepID=A0A0F6TQA9_9GAMM|nr:MerC domain-containing protein [Kangiella geojedonensis]AKE52037.1 hypothetical protein TQ33_1076 [Kangiella geojedonensis]